MRLLRERPHFPLGIHLALIRDSPEYRWGPAAAKGDVPSLLDPDTNELYVSNLGCSGPRSRGLQPGHGLPSVHDDVAVAGIELQRVAATATELAGNGRPRLQVADAALRIPMHTDHPGGSAFRTSGSMLDLATEGAMLSATPSGIRSCHIGPVKEDGRCLLRGPA
jgi:hypothetical protein